MFKYISVFDVLKIFIGFVTAVTINGCAKKVDKCPVREIENTTSVPDFADFDASTKTAVINTTRSSVKGKVPESKIDKSARSRKKKKTKNIDFSKKFLKLKASNKKSQSKTKSNIKTLSNQKPCDASKSKTNQTLPLKTTTSESHLEKTQNEASRSQKTALPVVGTPEIDKTVDSKVAY